ncbi:MAG: transposase [Microbacteriaceae bacterium]|nr:MAG: transposase [Microbacteriaceae bacterium]
MLLKGLAAWGGESGCRVACDVISDRVWAVIGPLFPPGKTGGRPPVDRRTMVEAAAWRFRTGAPWRDVPEPPDHGIGRSRGGLTTKVQLVADGRAAARIACWPSSTATAAGTSSSSTPASATHPSCSCVDGDGHQRVSRARWPRASIPTASATCLHSRPSSSIRSRIRYRGP